jgi:hypothetical protein
MNCLICVGIAERILCAGPWEERVCPECGHYRVCDELLLTLIDKGQIFDVSKTRQWLLAKSEDGEVPMVNITEALLMS